MDERIVDIDAPTGWLEKLREVRKMLVIEWKKKKGKTVGGKGKRSKKEKSILELMTTDQLAMFLGGKKSGRESNDGPAGS